MPWTSAHLPWLIKTKSTASTVDGVPIAVYEFQHKSDAAILSSWAKHFRNHYCLDTQIDVLRSGTGQTRAQYLTSIKFPDEKLAPGPSIRSGDFAEVLVADYLQYVLKYWVPRTRYTNKDVRNESTKGCDVIGFKILKSGCRSKRDTLAIYEAKAQLTGTTVDPRLQHAINDSGKDELRKAMSLNAIKQRLIDAGEMADAAVVERFQNFSDHPYTQAHGAVAVFSTPLYCAKSISASSAAAHPNKSNLALLVIRGDDLMDLVHQLYKRAANEA